DYKAQGIIIKQDVHFLRMVDIVKQIDKIKKITKDSYKVRYIHDKKIGSGNL
ncbi:841_t:CDS:1, partial [Funneliformis geosporum]